MISGKILARIYGHGRGWIFSAKDFLDIATHSTIWQALSRLHKKGIIRKIRRGVYDFPEMSLLHNGYSASDTDETAHTIARANGWTIVPSGASALNTLGLSTQVVSAWSYLSNGPTRTYTLEDGAPITFKRRTDKEAGGLSEKSAILVQAIKALGKEGIDDGVIKKLRENYSDKDMKRAMRECQYVTAWVYGIIKKIAAQEPDNA
jgi:hypothetical protein